MWRGARTAAQIVGAAGLTATAPAAYYVAAGSMDRKAWMLWAANLLFAINQIQFVHVRIHASHASGGREKMAAGRAFLIGQAVLMLLVVFACSSGLLSWYAAAAFVPVLWRGFAWFAAGAKPLAVRALGISELAYACVFGVLLAAGMRIA